MPVSDRKVQKFNRLLHLVRRQTPTSRVELARQVPWSTSTTSNFVQELLDRDLVQEELEGEERRGRQGVPLRLNPAYGRYVGIDLEAMRMRAVCVDFAGAVLLRRQVSLKGVSGRQDLLDRALRFIDEILAEVRASEGGPILGVGLAAPGVLDTRTGTILHYDMLPEVRDIPWRELVAQHSGLPCTMDNNIRAYTVAEWLEGAGEHLTDFICLGVRSGIGAGIVMAGRLLRGSHGYAGEAGYTPVPSAVPLSQWRTLQDTVSERALGIDMDDVDPSPLTDSAARRAGELLGAYLAGLASLLDPQAIILAGALVQHESPLWRHLDSAFRRHVLGDIADRVTLLPSRVGPYAAAIGICHLCFDADFPWQDAL